MSSCKGGIEVTYLRIFVYRRLNIRFYIKVTTSAALFVNVSYWPMIGLNFGFATVIQTPNKEMHFSPLKFVLLSLIALDDLRES